MNIVLGKIQRTDGGRPWRVFVADGYSGEITNHVHGFAVFFDLKDGHQVTDRSVEKCAMLKQSDWKEAVKAAVTDVKQEEE
jgi:hypothetical protein